MKFESPIEKLFAVALWRELAALELPVSVDLQAPIGPYRADFLLRLGAKRVVVECDGHDFHERTPEQAEHDRRRDRYFTAEGVPFLRFTGREVNRSAGDCAQEALRLLGTNTKQLEARRRRRALENWNWRRKQALTRATE